MSELMQIMSINKKLPELYEKQVFNKDGGLDFATAITGPPIFVFIVLNSVSKKEKELIQNGEVSVGVVAINTIPFLVVDYGNGLHFDMPILALSEEFTVGDNALNIVMINGRDHCVQSIRVLGLKTELIRELIGNVEKMQFDRNIAKVITESIYNSYSTEDILRRCKTQVFSKSHKGN